LVWVLSVTLTQVWLVRMYWDGSTNLRSAH
jgi:hypothetical protein